MNGTAKNVGLIVLGVAVGVAIAGLGLSDNNMAALSGSSVSAAQVDENPEPLYWVAPMDANYRRDKPGLSPMGMDLVPVYASENNGVDAGPGTISVSPEVVNNLGVRTAVASRQLMQFEVRTVGYVGYNQDDISLVHPRVEGWVEKVYIKAEGDPVIQGQPLYDLYSPTLVNAQEEYLFALSQGNRALIRGAEQRLATLQLPPQALATLKQTRRVSQTVTYYAPQSGVVDNLALRQGGFIKPGLTLLSIAALDEVWLEAEVFERQANLISVGQGVSIQLDFLPGDQREGVVDYIYPTLDAQTRTLRVRMRFANQDGKLKPNMFAEVVIHKQAEQASLTVPKEALIRGADSNRLVLALGEGRFKSVNVKVGRSNGQQVEILSGVQEGEQVVTSAQFLLDSESGKTSDFKRMHIPPAAADSMTMDDMNMDDMSMDSMSMDAVEQQDKPIDSMAPAMIPVPMNATPMSMPKATPNSQQDSSDAGHADSSLSSPVAIEALETQTLWIARQVQSDSEAQALVTAISNHRHALHSKVVL
ncbi:efflux RND transporter periplasmic adaptor subunit [Amphritea sp.]|uniref:efflux RND transporter periplasmic adaptor subunit n=1 Tax=Amphritea sp. TaxID=1872502 RepID=UPI003A8D03BF